MEEKKVAVIMSTYNGEKFVKEQIDSILNQTYKNIKLIVRDDGSRDKTVEIIKEYQKEHENIELVVGENLGFIKSFFELLKIAQADYYAYADQDDIWLPNKIELAVESLNALDNDKPNMVFGNSDYYDEKMALIGYGEKNRVYSFTNALFECVGQGMTMTINQKTRDCIVNHPPKNCFFHDWWTYLICIGTGNVAYNNVTTVKYRRMKTNATSEGQGYWNLLIWRVKNLLFKNGIKDIKRQMVNFKEIYYEQLHEENKKIIDLFSNEKYHFLIAMKKACYPKKLRRRRIDDLMLRVIFILGIL